MKENGLQWEDKRWDSSAPRSEISPSKVLQKTRASRYLSPDSCPLLGFPKISAKKIKTKTYKIQRILLFIDCTV